MGKIDKHFLGFTNSYDFTNKDKNIVDNLSYLFNRTSTMFAYKNLPKTIPYKEMELLIQSKGFGIFIEVDGEYYIVNGGLGGEGDVYNRPTQATISIPYLNYNETLEIGKDCVVVQNDSTKTGLKPMLEKYVTLLNENHISTMLAIINTRLQTIISANDDSTIESAKLYLKDIIDGKVGVIAEQRLFDSLKVNNTNTKNNNIGDLVELEQYIKASMYNELGLSANYNMKKERLINAEVELNNDILYPLIDDMMESRVLAIEEINSLFNLNIEVEFSSSWSYKNRVNEEISEPNTEDETEETEENTMENEIAEDENSEEETVNVVSEEVEEEETEEETISDEEETTEDEEEPTEDEVEEVEETEEEVEEETEEEVEEKEVEKEEETEEEKKKKDKK